MSEQNAINEERLKKFKNMGIPIPMAPIDPGSMKNLNADPEKLKKLEAIRNGAKKGEFKEIISKAEPKKMPGFAPLPTPKQKPNPNAPKSEIAVPLKSFTPASSADAEARLLEGALFGEDPRATAYSEPIQSSGEDRRIPSRESLLQEEYDSDPHGTEFLHNFKARMASKGFSKPIANASSGIQVVNPIQQTHTRQAVPTMSEVALEQKIIEVATVVATDIANTVSKTMIKQVLAEYAKQSGGLIIESDRVKKAEIVGKGVVKISGKLYKLTPVKETI